MNPITERFVADFAEILSSVLMHFVWQGTVLSLALVVLVKLLGVKNAQQRYLLSVGSLFLMAAAPFCTAYFCLNDKSVPEAAVATDFSPAAIEDHSIIAVVEQPATISTNHTGQKRLEISTPKWSGKIIFLCFDRLARWCFHSQHTIVNCIWYHPLDSAKSPDTS